MVSAPPRFLDLQADGTCGDMGAHSGATKRMSKILMEAYGCDRLIIIVLSLNRHFRRYYFSVRSLASRVELAITSGRKELHGNDRLRC